MAHFPSYPANATKADASVAATDHPAHHDILAGAVNWLDGQQGMPLGLAGATGGTRFVGATTSGAPTTGTFVVGDFVVDRAAGAIWTCTTAGTPGTWTNAGSIGPTGPAGPAGPTGPVGPAGTGVIDVRSYGAVGDGVHDDTAGIQAAVNAAAASTTARTVLIPDGTWLLGTTTSAESGWSYHIGVSASDVHIVGMGSSTVIKSAASGALTVGFLVTGSAKPAGGFGSWVSNWVTRVTGTNLTPCAAGVRSVTVASATGLGVGDFVLLKAGQLVPGTSDEPDGELNQIRSISGTTIGLWWPTSKAYAVEYALSGATTQTSTVNSGQPAQQPKLAKVTDRVSERFSLRDLFFDTPTIGWWSFCLQYVDVTMSGLRGTTGGCGTGVQYVRGSRQTDYQSRKTTVTSGATFMVAGAATCCNDVLIQDVRSVGEITSIHMHEGVADAQVRNVELVMPDTSGTDGSGISIAGRSYNTIIDSVRVDGGNTLSGIQNDGTCTAGGVITNCLIRSSAASGASIANYGTGWHVRGNTTTKAVYTDSTAGANTTFGNRHVLASGTNLNRTGFDIGSPITLGALYLPTMSTTPSIAGAQGPVIFLAPGSATSVTDLTGGQDQQLIYVLTTGTTTFVNGTFVLKGAANYLPASTTLMTFLHINGSWYEVSRTA